MSSGRKCAWWDESYTRALRVAKPLVNCAIRWPMHFRLRQFND